MNFNSMTDQAVAKELGRRIEQLRLERDLTQQAVADEVGLSRISYRRLEAGEAKLVNVVAVLRVFGQVSLLDHAIPDTVFSPMEQLKLQGKKRQRASGSRKLSSQTESGDETTHQEKAMDW
ncbi:helix-turn-helix transcriptional regulator [Marinicella litoralis]|uniref:Helix-turn-helix protein n=1 Tax=Marinicella litoralis TaxID=644220 RepID=A0A4R6XG50_9GAMM|nr:helix-turn-helix transcriptional regulator [Marinicella litoralis]TDR16780.1 helix-turn-helix protein [Marinicella litoralis]